MARVSVETFDTREEAERARLECLEAGKGVSYIVENLDGKFEFDVY